jgi:hypothetical protein
MARPMDITINHADLAGPEKDLGLTAENLKFVDGKNQVRVKVRIAGEPADITDAKAGFIKVKAPPEGNGPWSIVVTTPDEKILLDVLDLYYDPTIETFSVKKEEEVVDP